MKRILTIFSLMFIASVGFGQTNIFPTTGNVGIGTNSPNYPLDIQSNFPTLVTRIGSSSQTSYSNLYMLTDGGDAQIFKNGSLYSGYGGVNSLNFLNSNIAPIVFFQSSYERMRIHSNGFIGIGTTNPNYLLDIQSSSPTLVTRIGGSSQKSYSNIMLETDGGNAQIFKSGSLYSSFGGPNSLNILNYELTPITFYQSSNERMRIHSNGFIGIGTKNPNYPLDIQSSSPTLVTRVGGSSQTSYSNIMLETEGGNAQIFQCSSSYSNYGGASSLNIYNSNVAPITFYQSSNERMRIHSNGYIGIGTDSPNTLLQLDVHNNFDALKIVSSSRTGKEYTMGINNDGYFYLNDETNSERLTITQLGNVGIGTTDPGSFKLAVEGKLGAREVEVKTGSWADFVFAPTYELPTLKEVENYINENKHLPNVPSEKEVIENGINLGEMDATLLQKIEELTLYTIEQQKEIETLKKENQALKSISEKLIELQNRLDKVEGNK